IPAASSGVVTPIDSTTGLCAVTSASSTLAAPAPASPSSILETSLSLSSAASTLSSNPFVSLSLLHGSKPNWNTKNNNTLTPINPQVPQVLIRRILSDQICSSWYLAKIAALSLDPACSAVRSAS